MPERDSGWDDREGRSVAIKEDRPEGKVGPFEAV
jgi:hypothetical protein